MTTQKSEAEVAQEVYVHRHDPGEWAEEAENIAVRPARTAVVSFRLPLNELDALEDAAQEAGESLSEFVRKAIELRRSFRKPPPVIAISPGTDNVQIRASRENSAPRSDAPYSTTRTLTLSGTS
jgi:hypothetical protein